MTTDTIKLALTKKEATYLLHVLNESRSYPEVVIEESILVKIKTAYFGG